MIGECEMTGKSNVELFRVKIEGTMMNVCKECVKYGEKIDKPMSFRTQSRSFSHKDKNINTFVIKNYSTLIKQARESRNLKQSQLADQLNEKESLLHNIESGKLKPNFPLAKKLERFLKISLFETISTSNIPSTTTPHVSKELTMEAAFLAAMKKKKK